jgi:hypothetical protein
MLKPSKMFRNASWAIALLAGVCVTQSAKAINHGTFIGPNIMYLNVTEDPVKIPGPSPVQLFGPPSNATGFLLSSDDLEFDATGFTATSSDGGFAYTDADFSTTIMSNTPLQVINSLVLQEFGTYTLFGGTALGTTASIGIGGLTAVVTEQNGLNTPDVVLPFLITFTNPSVGAAPDVQSPTSMTLQATGGAHFLKDWTATVVFDLSVAPGATKITLDFDNGLFTTSELNSFSFIHKKDLKIITTAVPEPGTLILGAMGGLGLLVMGRKSWKKRQIA